MAKSFRVRKISYQWITLIVVLALAIVWICLDRENYWGLFGLLGPLGLTLDQMLTRIQIRDNGDVWIRRGFTGVARFHGISKLTMKYQVAIIGGGPAGYTAAELAGKAGLSVVLFEKNNVGGVCLNEGCIPTKTLLYASKLSYICMNARKYNVSADAITCDLPKMIARKAKVVRKLVLGIKAKLNAAHVTLVNGEASIVDKNTVRCGEETYECEHLMLCTGSRTVIPPIPGIDKVAYWTHREALDNKALPQSLVIVGGGVIGMEFASFFCDLGVKVTVIEMMDEILNGIDREIASLLRAEYAKRGVVFKLGAKVTQLKQDDSGIYVCYESEGRFRAGKLRLGIYRKALHQGGRATPHLGSECLCVRRPERSFPFGAYGGTGSRNRRRGYLGQGRADELSRHTGCGLHASRSGIGREDRRSPAKRRHRIPGNQVPDDLFRAFCSRE